MESKQEIKQEIKQKIKTESDWLREAAERHERKGFPVWALLYRNDALRLESDSLTLTLQSR